MASLLISLGPAVYLVAQSPDEVALARLAVTAHSTGNLLVEQLLLRRVAMESSDEFADAARHRLAESTLESGNYSETIRLLNAADGYEDETSPQVRRDRALIGEAYRRSGDAATVTQILNKILDTTPNPTQPDDAALLAAKSLDAIPTAMDESEHFRRAAIYQFNRYWAEARSHYEQVKATPDAAEALFQIGRGYSQDARYAEAIPDFQRVIDQFPDTQQARDSLLNIASAYSRIGNTDEAISRYQQFIDKYSTDDKAPRAYLNIVDIYRDLGDDAHALEWCQKTEAAFTGKTPEALAIFDEAKIYASRDEHESEVAALDRLKGRSDLGGANMSGGTTLNEVSRMRAYALRPLPIVMDVVGHGAPGLRPIESAIPTPSRTDFPALYTEILLRHSWTKSLDPRLLLAIMRQESKFDPQARSNAAARGLMQFTHPQAVKIATELGWTYFSDDELYSPENSIALAARYISDLNAMFPNQTEAVVASYNGGEDNVKRWMARAKSDKPERYVPEIVYGQTKDYVQKVMANYRVYQQLYDEQLRPK